MIAPKRLSVKFFVKNPEAVQIEAFTGVLQRWIQEKAIGGLLIDVVDYKHMHEGPGIILIGDESDYGMDSRDGRWGLMLTIKRHTQESLEDLLQMAFPLVVRAAALLEREDTLNGIEFDFSAAKVEFLDRLNYPNRPETWDQLRDTLQTFAAQTFRETVEITSVHSDPRETFALRIQAEGDLASEQLLANLASPVANV